jgi:dipeptidyl aminopeptidase/acylaminoacyl peptidase
MINWLNGHTNRFKCLVNHDGIFSLRHLYYSTEELWFPEWEFGLPFALDGRAAGSDYVTYSPEEYVCNWKTPCLVIQGGRDYRVVETEAIAAFTALQRRGVPSRMLYFPDEHHWCLKAAHSILWHDTVFQWLRQWLSAPVPALAPALASATKE